MALEKVVICSAQSDIVDLIRKVLREHDADEVTTVTSEKECIEALTTIDASMLMLDWAIGEAQAVKILAAIQGTHPAGVRPVFLFSRNDDDDLAGVAMEFAVTQVHCGPVSMSVMKERVETLLDTHIYAKDVRDQLETVVKARRGGDKDREIKLMEELQARFPDDEFIACEMADLYFRIDSVDDAMSLLKPFMEKEERHPRLSSTYGRCLMKLGEFEEATVYLQQADLVNPYNVKRLVNLGEAYLQLDMPARAKAKYDRALEMEPNNRDAKRGVGQSLLMLGDINEALVFLKQVSDASEMASVFNVAAVIGIRNGRYEDGMTLYRTAVKTVGAKQPQILAKLAFNMGLAHYRRSEYAEALYYFTISAKLDDTYRKAKAGQDALEKAVKPNDRISVPDSNMDALLVEKFEEDDMLDGEDVEFKGAGADYDMDF